MRFVIVFIAATLVSQCSWLAFAQTDTEKPIAIRPEQGLESIGKTVRVRLTVRAIGRGSGDRHLMHSGPKWDAPGNLQIRLSPEIREAYAKQGIEKPNSHFLKKTIEVTGKVIELRPGGKRCAAIELQSTSDLKVVTGDAPKPPGATVIQPEQGLQFVGKRVRVKLTVQSIGRGGEFQNLNSGEAYNSPGNLQIRIGAAVVAAFAKQGIDQPTQHFLRKRIEVVGTVGETRPGGFRVATITLSTADDLSYVLESTRKAPAVSELLNRRIDLYLRDGRRYGDVLVTGLEMGSVRESLASLKVKVGETGPRLFRAAAVEEIVVDGVPLDLSYDRGTRALAVDAEKRAGRMKEAEETERRVLALGKRLWPRVSDEEHAEWLEQHREFATTVQKHFPQLPLRIIETKYYLILTDIPDVEARRSLGYLDTLYDEMCRAFGIPLGSNIWYGKCVVCAFQNRADFIRFELEVMKNTKGNPTNAGGICHGGGTGRVVISLFSKGNQTARFATVLVHETSHGIASRVLSDIRIPSWLNEGMAVWIAGYIVKDDQTLERSQRKSVVALREQQTLSGFFEALQIPGDHYGAGSAMVDILIRKDSDRFREFFTDIKKGYPQDEALKRSYEMTFDELTQLYGLSIGLPNLRP